MKSKGYVVYEGIGVLNILSMQSIKKDSGEISNKFDDIFKSILQNENGNWNLFEYKITTMAGFVPGTTNLPQNVALLSLGQYIDQGEIVVKSRYKYLKLNSLLYIEIIT
jgi:hypothetical protein